MKTREQIEKALENNEFHVEYMPTVDLASGHCTGAEALIRWISHGENIAPDEFIPLIENSMLSGIVTYRIIDRVAQDLLDWMKQHDGIHISVNVPPEIIGRGGLQYAVEKSGLIHCLDKLIMEITERGFPDQLALDTLGEIKGRVKVAIDDFGTGDANMMRLSQLTADIIKLDKYFVSQITTTNPEPKIVTGLVAFAKAMGFDIIAEGVENQLQVDTLTSLKVDMAQGFFFSHPLMPEEFVQFHNQRNKALDSADVLLT